MGTIVLRSLLVISDKEHANDLAAFARQRLASLDRSLEDRVLGPHSESINGHVTFVVAPCGSKEGWGLADQHEAVLREVAERCRAINEAAGFEVAEALYVETGDWGKRMESWTDAGS